MKIKLIGALPRLLKEAGFSPGEIYEAWKSEVNTKYGAVEVRKLVDDQEVKGTVYKENYIIIHGGKN